MYNVKTIIFYSFVITFILLFIFSFEFTKKISKNLFIASLPLSALQDTEINNYDLKPIESFQEDSGSQQEVKKENIITKTVPEYSKQDQIDDILEKIDILNQQITDLRISESMQVESAQIENKNLPEQAPESPVIEEISQETEVNDQLYTNIETIEYSFSGNNPVYPKILISEVQISGLGDEKQEFVELYNPEEKDIDLTGWYLQRKTKTASSYSTFVPNILFSGKKITSKGYFLVAREDFVFVNQADIVVDNPLTEDNSLMLKNPSGEISDKVGWGDAQDYELLATINPLQGKSIGRKIVVGQPYDININLEDFELNQPSPKTINTTYVFVEPTILEPVDLVPPFVNFTLDTLQKSLNITINFTLIDPIGLVSPSGIDSYIFRWQKDLENGAWQEETEQKVDESPISINIQKDFIGEDEKNYYFQVKVKDTAGNESDWLPTIPATTKISLFKKILISEVKTEGQSAKDEFIQLYNPNDILVNLVGFALKKKTSGGIESNLVSTDAFIGTVGPMDYFLIAPQDNDDGTKNYMGEIVPDLRYSGTSFSIADNNTVLLYNADDQLLDKVGFGTAVDFETAPAQNPGENKSIKRSETFYDTDNNEEDFNISGQEDIEAPLIIEDLLESELPQDIEPHTVVINEIAWMGGLDSANEEWIELFNPGIEAVNLFGWELISADGTPSIQLSGLIEVNGFYLLERTDDDSISDIIADQIYTGVLGNGGEDIYLKDAFGGIVDELNCAQGWFAGDNDTKQTMQRKDPLFLGNSVDNWQTSQEAGGTPKF
ncbi:MAG: Phospholipase D/competence protein ComEA helix-hairpin-helix domain protein [Parcubacteria group bacterium GW2011_GWA2_33_14]|nr:MAG: Phospholipase D/competence protein ComEA helix-hairpin-helix domain protein [Parcubacteria group bacterium GW2011_GWA2_33_14]